MSDDTKTPDEELKKTQAIVDTEQKAEESFLEEETAPVSIETGEDLTGDAKPTPLDEFGDPVTELTDTEASAVLEGEEAIAALRTISTSSSKELSIAMNQFIAEHPGKQGAEDIKEMMTSKTWLRALYFMKDSFSAENNAALSRDTLKDRKFEKHTEFPLTDKRSTVVNYNGKLTGKKAANAFTATMEGLMKVNLVNSGFYIVIKPLKLEELDQFFNSVDIEGDQLGRVLGGHFYMCHDVMIKEKFMQLIEYVTVRSNLTTWNTDGGITEAVSHNDYETLGWAVMYLMHQKGFRIDRVCGAKGCNALDSAHLFNFMDMKLVDVEFFTPEQIAHMKSGKQITLAEAIEYQEGLKGHGSTFDCAGNRFTTQVPRVGQYIDYCNDLIASITANVHGEFSTKERSAMTRDGIFLYRNFRPWIKDVGRLDLDDPSKVVFTSDEDSAIETVFDIILRNDDSTINDKFTEEVIEHIKASKSVIIAQHEGGCKTCGHEGDNLVGGYLPITPQQLFFYLTYRKLSTVGAN